MADQAGPGGNGIEGPAKMPGSSTIVIAREDLSVPGSEEDQPRPATASEIERRFFQLIRESRPDVIVLDLSRARNAGANTIRKIRDRCGVPILVVCAQEDASVQDYRICGAAECMHAPVDIVDFNDTIQRIIRLTRRSPHSSEPSAFVFGGITFRPDDSTLRDTKGSTVRLTTSENDLLCYLVTRPRKVCTRAQIGWDLYGRHQPISDRAIDVVVNRLRKKLASVDGGHPHNFLKTEFRKGYRFVADVVASSGGGPDGDQA